MSNKIDNISLVRPGQNQTSSADLDSKLFLRMKWEEWESLNGKPNEKGLLFLAGDNDGFIIPTETFRNAAALKIAVDNRITMLEQQNIFPDAPSLASIKPNVGGVPSSEDTLRVYTERSQMFIDNVKREYCFYQKLYLSSVMQFMASLSSASAGAGQPTTADQFRQVAILNNNKVNTIIALVNGMASKRYSVNFGFQSSINQLNQEITSAGESLRSANKIFNDNNLQASINRRMVEYTAEKNRANENLMTLFFTLNVVAIASLFVLARNL